MNIAVLETAKTAIPDGDELVSRARAMIPALRARADEVEEARRVPDDIIQMFREAGFFRILQPKSHGGWEMNPIVFMRVLGELGRGCCSSAWNMMILGVHNWEFGIMDPRAADDVWGVNDETVIASSYAPTGELTRVEGGGANGPHPAAATTAHGLSSARLRRMNRACR